MKKLSQKGVVESTILYFVIAAMALLFVPNPLSSAVGVGIRPNKTVQRESTYDKVELLRDKGGNPVLAVDGAFLARRTGGASMSDVDKQQKVSLWEQLRALPVLWLFLMFLGGFFPVVAGVMAKINVGIKKRWKEAAGQKEALLSDTKKIVMGLDRAFSTLPCRGRSIAPRSPRRSRMT